jgi:hypothetical protein
VKDSEEHQTFEARQAALGDQITCEPDPETRGKLRIEREAQGNEYAAKLSAGLAVVLEVSGRYDDAKDMRLAAETRAAIAAELRGPDQTPPEKGGADQIKAEFSKDAAAVGQAIGLGPTARTVFVAEYPAPEQGQQAAHPQSAMMVGVAIDRGGPGETMQLRQIVQNRPEPRASLDSEQAEPHRPGTARPVVEPNGQHDEAATHDKVLLERHADESSKRQEAEDGALRGGKSDDRKATYAKTLESLREQVKADKETYGEKPEQENEQGRDPGQGASHTAAFRSFGGR